MPLSVREQNDFKAAGLINNNPFRFNYLFDREWADPDDLLVVEEALNQCLDLKSYGNLKAINFLFIAGAERTDEQYIQYNTDAKEIEVCLLAAYPILLEAASSKTIPAFIARHFLAAIPLFAEIPVHEFAISSFYRAVESLFRQRGWMKTAPPCLDPSTIYLVRGTDYQSGLPSGGLASFYVRKIARQEWFDQIDAGGFGAWLNRRFDLSDYGTGVQTLYLTLLADDPLGGSTGFGSTYFRPDREWHLSLPLSPPVDGTKSPVLALIQALSREDWERPQGFALDSFFQDLKKQSAS